MNRNPFQQIVDTYKDDFLKLYINFQSLRGGLIIKRGYRVFYSDTEREYYDNQMIDDMLRNYDALYDKYISIPHPHLVNLKKRIGPYQLSRLLRETWY